MAGVMKLLFDFLPLIVFFAAFKRFDIYVATVAVIVATLGQVVWLKLRKRPVPVQTWLGLGIVAVFGGATLFLRDEWFVKLKPTVLYWTMAGALLFGRMVLGRDFLKSLVGEHLTMGPAGWALMNRMWIGFFLVLGAANLYVARYFPTATWVTFKVFWCTGALLAFSVLQAFALAKHLPPDDGDQPADGTTSA
jgi:intracellular septation protein